MLTYAKWIASPTPAAHRGLDYVKTFTVKGEVEKCTLTATAIGVYAPYLNGGRIGNDVLAPGFTAFQKRVLYRTYEVEGVKVGENELRIGVGSGWAVSKIGWNKDIPSFFPEPALIATLLISYKDGTEERIITDTSWSVMTTPVTYSTIYDGENADFSLPIQALGNAKEIEAPDTTLVPHDGVPITEHERLKPRALIITPKGERVLDFGQNMAGYVEVRIKGNKGDRIHLNYAEVLDAEGNFYTENYRTALSENYITLSGGEDVFKPIYTFHGFRYIRLTEYPFAEVDTDAFTAIAVYSDMERIGDFACGNPKINQLYHNVIWGQRSNFLDLPTDCPQRNERLGWTGDAQVFCRTASLNYDTEKFFTKWLADVAAEQGENGKVRGVAPGGNLVDAMPSAAWGDVACVAPMEMYLNYGSKELLRKHLPMMKGWIKYMRGFGPEEYLWLGGNHFGDWLAMDAGEDSYMGATCTDLIASAYFAYSTSLLIKALKALGEDASEYEELYTKVKAAFRARFTDGGVPKAKVPTYRYGRDKDGNYGLNVEMPSTCNTQTSLTLMLHFGLYEGEDERQMLADMLVESIEKNGNRMTTGFVGTPYIMHALTDAGRADVAYTLFLQEKSPSWLYSVNHGATTMWEHWNGIKEDGSFWSKDMNSFNHYAYGAVYDWMLGKMIGLNPDIDSPAFKRVKITPHPSKEIGWAKASLKTRNGQISVGWYINEDGTHYDIDLPSGVSATLRLSCGKEYNLLGGSHVFTEA